MQIEPTGCTVEGSKAGLFSAYTISSVQGKGNSSDCAQANSDYLSVENLERRHDAVRAQQLLAQLANDWDAGDDEGPASDAAAGRAAAEL